MAGSRLQRSRDQQMRQALRRPEGVSRPLFVEHGLLSQQDLEAKHANQHAHMRTLAASVIVSASSERRASSSTSTAGGTCAASVMHTRSLRTAVNAVSMISVPGHGMRGCDHAVFQACTGGDKAPQRCCCRAPSLHVR